MIRFFTTLCIAALCSSPALANPGDECEIVVVKDVVDADGGRMTVATYQPATDFIAEARKDATSVDLSHEGAPIRGVICVRNDLVPQNADYAILATGIPLSLSQDFDSANSDILTVYFDDGQFTHKYTSDYPMSSEFEDALVGTLQDFSSRDHGLVKTTKSDN